MQSNVNVMKDTIRVTIALDKNLATLFEQMRGELKTSQSELIRRAIRFYFDYKNILESISNTQTDIYLDMLPTGEHVILDVDHWLSCLKFIECSLDQDMFWDTHRKIARAHAEQLSQKVKTVEEILERFAACNFFKVKKDTNNRFTLLLGSEIPQKFLKILLEEVLEGLGYKIEIKEDFAKLRLSLTKS